jgi:hypothetical protein
MGNSLAPERSFPRVAVGASALRSALGISSLPHRGSSSCLRHLRPFASETHARFALLSVRPFAPVTLGYYGLCWLLAPLARGPFRPEARSPQVRTRPFPARPPDVRRLGLDHRSFAVVCPLAPLGAASNRVLVHRPAVSLPASSPRSVALPQLRFTSIRMVSSRRELHPQGRAHAGRTKARGPPPCGDGPRRDTRAASQKSMPPMPPPWPWPPPAAGFSSFGSSAISASVVSMRPATDAEF